MKARKNLIVGQSGGPTAVINASLSGVLTEAAQNKNIDHVFGMVNGIEGFLKDQVIDLELAVPKKDRWNLAITPAAYLGSCRFKLPADLNDPIYAALFEKFEQLDIGYFLYIGGNDSMDTVDKLSKYNDKINGGLVFVGVPKTIDNDLTETDHTPGYGSAAKFVATTVREITMDAEVYDKPSITIVEIMGRNSGFLTASSILARRFENDNPRMIYLPETDFDCDIFVERVKKEVEEHQNLVVCVSEGIHDASGKLICEYDSEVGLDAFGHKMLAGCGKYLERLVHGKLGIKARSVELNVVQRCHGSLLSGTDVEEAFECGVKGVKAATFGLTGTMITMNRADNKKGTYEIKYLPKPVGEISNGVKPVPSEWISENGSDLKKEFLDYVSPLIEGEITIPSIKGMPKYLSRK